MEKVERYRRIIRRLATEYQDFYRRETKTDVDTEILADDGNGQYMVMRIGWRGETRVKRPLFYLRLRNDKIWIEEDWTKEGIAIELMAAGVCREDIALAFREPSVRSETELAA